MIKHIVFFKLRDVEGKNVKMQEIKQELEKLPSIIKELDEIHVGINVNPAEEWDLCLEAIVENMENLEIYSKHPAHQNIVKTLIAPIKEGRACVDYRI